MTTFRSSLPTTREVTSSRNTGEPMSTVTSRARPSKLSISTAASPPWVWIVKRDVPPVRRVSNSHLANVRSPLPPFSALRRQDHLAELGAGLEVGEGLVTVGEREDAIDGWPQVVGVDVVEHVAELGVIAHGRGD